ncbi:MAG: sulfur relay protein DsrC [Bacteroidetes bacterium GWA2_30_7]|nr:MAG: sulfur relay protein DsrC [Bacteroidetes bacterium GWA2_30_7]
MAQKQFSGVTVDVNDEGYFTNSSQWTIDIAKAIAIEEGIQLSDKHIDVLSFIRKSVAGGAALTIRSMGKSGIVDVKEFYGLFPGAPLKKATKIAGVPKPTSCI